MSIEVRLPELGQGVTSATVAAWLKAVGDRVTIGETIVEIETDKTTVEVAASGSGVLGKVVVHAGEKCAPAGLLAIISDEITNPDDERKQAPVLNKAMPVRLDTSAEAKPARVVRSSQSEHVSDMFEIATPLAHRMAALAGLTVHELSAAADGVITKRQVDEARTRRAGSSIAVAAQGDVSDDQQLRPESRDQPVSAVRRVSAKRLERAKQEIPHFYLHVDCRVDSLLDARTRLNAGLDNDTKITVTDFVIAAVARALTAHPVANATWVGNSIRVYQNVDVAVAVDTPNGLMTPIVREAQNQNLAQLSRALRSLSHRARAGSLQPHEYNGGTCTVSNLGMFNVTRIVPIINPPQACIFGIGRAEAAPVVQNNALTIGHIMNVTLAADHRVLDGAEGARLLAHVRELIEDPMRLALSM